MSFSTDVKEELCRELPEAQHCLMAEWKALYYFLGNVQTEPGKEAVSLVTENVVVARRAMRLIRACFPIRPELRIRRQKKGNQYELRVAKASDATLLLKETGIFAPSAWKDEIRMTCCKRAFLRGAFLAAGSVSDPGKSYHFEINCRSLEQGNWLTELFAEFGVKSGVTLRKGKHLLYIKDSSSIVDALGVLGAFQSLMQMENVRIVKEMRNSANRQYNCDAANISKMVRAAGRQANDIRYIETHGGLGQLSETLRKTAELRLEHPDVSIEELGTMLDPPVGKSGVNHRLRKISQLAESLREKEAEG